MNSTSSLTYTKLAQASKLAQELITKKELAKRCACTTRHIDNLTTSGAIQKIKLGNCSRYDWLDVVESLKAQSRKEQV